MEVHKYDAVSNPIDSIAAKACARIHVLSATQFYGSFEIKFENGKIINCKKTESIKL